MASKSDCSVRALRRALSHDGYRGVLSYSVPEAIHLAREGFSDILVAYPSVNSVALRELAADPKLRDQITVMVNSTDHLDLIAAAAGGAGPVRVCMDIDCTLRLPGPVVGPRRSAVRTPDAVRELAAEIARRPHLRLVGVMG